MRKHYTDESGSALLIALCLLMMLTAVALLAVDVSHTEMELSFNQIHQDQSFYVAEAGVKHAQGIKNADHDWDTGLQEVHFGQGSYSVTVHDSTTNPDLVDTVVLVSTGTVKGAQSVVEVTLVPEPFCPYHYGLFAYESVTIENAVSTDSWNSDSGSFDGTVSEEYGSIGSNGQITIENNPTIGGDVTTALPGGITITGSGKVLGDTSTTAPEQDFSDLVAPEMFEWAQDNNSAPGGISGSFSFNMGTKNLTLGGGQTATLSSGTYFLNDIRLAQSASLRLAPGAEVELYVTGDVELRNQASVNAGGAPAALKVFSLGSRFSMGQTSRFSGVVVAPNVDFDLNNNVDFYGSFIANRIRIRNNPSFHYDRSLADFSNGYTGEMIAVAWRELK